MNNERIGISQKKLRRLAHRTLEVVARHIESSPQLRSLEQKLVAAAASFGTLYDQGKRDQAVSQRLMVEARQKLAVLRNVLGEWRGLLERDLRDGGTTLRLASSVPADLLVEAERTIELVATSAADGSFADAQRVLDELRPAFEDASAAWNLAQAKLAERQDQASELRAAAREFHVELIFLRRTLRAVLGPQHRDYQKLRPSGRAAASTDDEDETLDEPTVHEGETDTEPTVRDDTANAA